MSKKKEFIFDNGDDNGIDYSEQGNRMKKSPKFVKNNT